MLLEFLSDQLKVQSQIDKERRKAREERLLQKSGSGAPKKIESTEVSSVLSRALLVATF